MTATPSALPAYHEYQTAFHHAFRPELYRALDQLPLRRDSRALDAPCGDGFYARRLAERVPAGRLVALDSSDAYLEEAARLPGVEAVKGDAYHLPFPDGTFDLAWCAQSLISLDDPAAALRELARVVRPGGTVAVLESDEVHHVLLPWPVELELELHRALLQASARRYGDRGKLAPARRVRGLLREAGLRRRRKLTMPADRAPPWGEAEARFLRLHLRYLEDLVGPGLIRPARAGFLGDADAEMTCLSVVHLATKPA